MIKRGEIYFIDFDPAIGHEQKGRRPALVVSCNDVNRLPLVATVIVGSRGEKMARDFWTTVRTKAAETGLKYDTVFYAMQIRALDHSRFRDARGKPLAPAGVMPPAKMAEVERALRLVLDLDD